MKYLLLQNPGHNRVYYKASDKLALAELSIACKKLEAECSEIKITEIAAIRYLSFQTKHELDSNDLEIISKLSFAFAIFKTNDTNNSLLEPVKIIQYQYIDSKISSLLKYQGKTNELFTKMMINVGLLSSHFSYKDNISLLDPVAGKGTTLFESSIYGFDSYGIELEQKSVNEASLFFKKFIEEERYKHKIEKKQVSGSSKSNATFIQEFEYAKTKDEFKTTNTKKLGVICGKSQDAADYFKRNQFHLIIGDLPYGIQHGNKGSQTSGNITRNPSELLDDCLPSWKKVLKKGGVIVVAWNSFVASPKKLMDIFQKHEFNVLHESPYDQFEHMVDKSIKRDIIVAIKNR